MKKKLCFVIMGFGTKTDPSTGRPLDLDQTYKNIIQPAVIKSDYECIRADEIQDSSLIDKSMYALLIHADLVIADISTYNPNAIYELGIRHAVRPFSTIIIKEEEGKIPFDLDHNRIFSYKHLGKDIGADESIRCINKLSMIIDEISSVKTIDSPMYEYIKDINPPTLPSDVYDSMIDDLAHKEKTLFALVEKAKKNMADNDFISASEYWGKARVLKPDEPFFIQQLALCRYKSKKPSEGVALTEALPIIEELLPTNDPETLGIIGAIYKRLYLLNKDVQYLNRAIEYYNKGFNINKNYYTGENYANCLNLKEVIETNEEEKIYLKIEAKKTREILIKNLDYLVQFDNIDNRPDKKWIFATLANCYFSIDNDVKGIEYELSFLELALDWDKNSYYESKENLIKYKSK